MTMLLLALLGHAGYIPGPSMSPVGVAPFVTAQPPTGQVTAIITVVPLLLTADVDNSPTLQPWLDALPANSVVNFPAGVWTFDQVVKFKRTMTVLGVSKESTRLVGRLSNANAQVINVDSVPSAKVNNFTIRNITFQYAGTGTGVHNCILVNGDDFVMEDCDWQDCHHEGVVVSGLCFSAKIRRCEARNCGFGNVTYALSTAGFNAHSHGRSATDRAVYEDCRAVNCSQGFEIDGHHTTVSRCIAEQPNLATTPQIGFNVGSTGMGIWDIEIVNCTAKGYSTNLQSGNGIGKFSGLNVHDNLFDGGLVSVAGGMTTNSNPGGTAAIGQDPPDTGQSHVDRNTFIIRGPAIKTVVQYNPGPAAANEVLGRENFTFNDNAVFVVSGATGTDPIMAQAGKIAGIVEMKGNKFFNFDTATSRGDFAAFSNNANVATPGAPNLTVSGNLIVKSAGDLRAVSVKIEGAP